MALSTTFAQFAPETTKFAKKNSVKWVISPFKVIQGPDLCTNRKLIYDFLYQDDS